MTLNFNPEWKLNKLKFKHNALIPSSFRMLIIGSSGSGKSFRLFNMLLQPGFLDYNRLFIFSPSIHQPEYQLLIHGFKNKLHKHHIQLIIDNQEKIGINEPKEAIEVFESYLDKEDKWDDTAGKQGSIECYTFNSIHELPPPETFDKTKKNLFIIDDSMMLDQKPISNYFVYGRHNNINIIYLAQNYFQLPKKSIRDNANYLILFPLGKSDITSLYRTVTSADFDKYDRFQNFCQQAWKEPFSFMTIDKFNKDPNKRYGIGFNSFYNINHNKMENFKTSSELNELKRKAVESENELRDTYSQHRNMTLGFTESASKLFQPITKNLEEVKTEVSGVKQEIHDSRGLPNAGTNTFYSTRTKVEYIDPEIYEEPLFGLHQENTFRKDEFIFGAIFDLDKNVTPDTLFTTPKPWPHRMYVNMDEGRITAHKGEDEYNDRDLEVQLTDELFDVLTKNIIVKQGKNRMVRKDVEADYLALIDFCIGDELRNLATRSKLQSQETIDLIDKFSQVHKFSDWIAPKYNVQSRWQPARIRKGKGTIVIPGEFNEQLKRMLLLLGASEAGNKDANLNEFTSILDTLRNNKKLSKKGYQILLQRFKD